MSKLQIVRRCYSCGTILQNENPNEPGYISKKDVFESPDSLVVFCDKCWREEKINSLPKSLSVGKDYLEILKDAAASDALIVYVIDLFSFECQFIDEVANIIGSSKMIVIGNKRDLLPKKAKDSDIKEYVAHRFRMAQYNVKAENVELAALTSSSNISHISKRIAEERKGHDVYIIGATGAGKTLFLSSFLRSYINASKQYVETTNYPGTKLKVMQIPLDNSSLIYDTPGTPLDNSFLGKVEIKTLREIVPSSAISPRTVSLGKKESLFIGGLARIELIDGKTTAINGFFSSEVTLRKSNKSTDVAFAKAIEKGVVRPTSSIARIPSDFDVYDIEVEEKGQRDIGIAGLGWISFKAADQKFRVFVPKGISIYTTRAKIK